MKIIDSVAVKSMKFRWLNLALDEDYPNTPVVTKELDELEDNIKGFGK